MNRAEDMIKVEVPPLTREELITLREAAYQQWLSERQGTAIHFPTGLDDMSPYEIFYRAVNDGYMSCYGDFRDVILASQDQDQQ